MSDLDDLYNSTYITPEQCRENYERKKVQDHQDAIDNYILKLLSYFKLAFENGLVGVEYTIPLSLETDVVNKIGIQYPNITIKKSETGGAEYNFTYQRKHHQE